MAVNLAVPLQQRYGAVPVMARITGLGALWTAPYGLYGLAGSAFGWSALLAVLAVGIVGTGVAYWIMGTLVGRAGSVRASFITYLIPVVALVLGVAVRGDRVGGTGRRGCYSGYHRRSAGCPPRTLTAARRA